MGYLLLSIIAASGLVVSTAFHIMTWLQLEPPWGTSVLILHIGWLILWFPLVVCANRTMPNPRRGNLEHLLAELPGWVRLATYSLFVYAIFNFAIFIASTRRYPKHELPPFVVLRGFSGHWMLFYFIASSGFVALWRLCRKRKGPARSPIRNEQL